MADFAGTWRSSRLTAPLCLHANGEWEIKDEHNNVLQYGIWQVTDNAFLWSFKSATGIEHDRNVLTFVSKDEFRLLEQDGATTVFQRLP